MRESTLERSKFAMLQPKALAYDVDPAGDYMKPGNNPAEQAFQLLKCGYDLLLHVVDHAFPVLDRRTRKRGPKWIRQSMLTRGEYGSMMLGHAAPALMAQVGRLTGDEPAELTVDHHRRLYETVKSFYPLGKEDNRFVEFCLREFLTMEEHKPRRNVADGVQPGNEYSQALIRGENPDDDPELVAIQREYALDFFIDTAIHSAIFKTLALNDQQLLRDKIVRFIELDEKDAAALRARARRAWVDGIKSYLEYARLDAR